MNRSDVGRPPVVPVMDGRARGSDDEIEIESAAGFEAGLDDAVTRMERALRMAQAGAGAISFDSSLPDPERELLSALRAMGDQAVSFSTEGGDHSRDEAAAKVARCLHRVLEQVGALTRVETRVDGQLLLSTSVGLTGDCTSALSQVSAPSELETHVKSLAEQLRLRRARTRLVLSTVQMAMKVALATGTANPWLAFPAVFRFIRDVIAEPRPIVPTA
jgi:hypothetical protein